MKHVGKQISTDHKVILLFREVPGEPDNCLVCKTASLSQDDHDSLISVLESDEGQQTSTLADVLSTRMNGAGRPILESLHLGGRIIKLPADDVALTPDTKTAIKLSEINAAIRGQEQETSSDQREGALSDADIAADLRRQAAGMQKEAERLLAEAEMLSPTKKARAKKAPAKKTTTKKATKARATA